MNALARQNSAGKLNEIRRSLAWVIALSKGFKAREAPTALYWMRHDLRIILARVEEAIGNEGDAA